MKSKMRLHFSSHSSKFAAAKLGLRSSRNLCYCERNLVNLNPKPYAIKLQEELAESPVLVVCLDHTRKPSRDSPCPTSIEELPPRCTLGQLPDVLGIPANTHILVSLQTMVWVYA